MNSAKVEIDDSEVRDFLKQLPESMFAGVKKTFAKALFAAHKDVLNNFNNSNQISSDKLTSRTGLLAKSINVELNGSKLSNLNGIVYSDVTYAPMQETGGIVKAKKAYANLPGGPYLNIPLPDNLTAAGVMRKNALEVFESGGFIILSKNRNYIVMDNTGKPMFVLKKEVEIPARLGMEIAMINQIPNIIGDLKTMELQ